MISNGSSILALISDSDIVIKIVMLTLLIFSVWSWSIIFNKYVTLKRIHDKTVYFEKVFWSGQPLDQLYNRMRDRVDHPSGTIFISAMRELEKYNVENIKIKSTLAGMKERIHLAMVITKNKQLNLLEQSISMLATIGSASPFIGLFGTVWGIMHSFQAIAVSKNTGLNVVAPGIAEALLATAIGLIVAIPAVIFYNILSGKMNDLSERMDNFISEVYILITKEIDNGVNS